MFHSSQKKSYIIRIQLFVESKNLREWIISGFFGSTPLMHLLEQHTISFPTDEQSLLVTHGKEKNGIRPSFSGHIRLLIVVFRLTIFVSVTLTFTIGLSFMVSCDLFLLVITESRTDQFQSRQRLVVNIFTMFIILRQDSFYASIFAANHSFS